MNRNELSILRGPTLHKEELMNVVSPAGSLANEIPLPTNSGRGIWPVIQIRAYSREDYPFTIDGIPVVTFKQLTLFRLTLRDSEGNVLVQDLPLSTVCRLNNQGDVRRLKTFDRLPVNFEKSFLRTQLATRAIVPLQFSYAE